MSDEMATPRNLPHRRRKTDGNMTHSWKAKLAAGLLGLASTIAGGYYSGLTAVADRDRAQSERVRALEVRQEEQYRALLLRLDDMRLDINGARSEILSILKERR